MNMNENKLVLGLFLAAFITVATIAISLEYFKTQRTIACYEYAKINNKVDCENSK